MQLMFYLNMWWSEMPFVQKNLNAPKNYWCFKNDDFTVWKKNNINALEGKKMFRNEIWNESMNFIFLRS